MHYIPHQAHTFHYTSRRELVYGRKGMVATTHPLASQAGLEVLKKGGNAIDAAIAAAAALTVVEPGSNGIGGDSFSIIWHNNKMHGLNASGPAPQLMKREILKEKGETINTHGFDPVTVPGVPGGWAELSEKFGRLPLKEVLEPAAVIAEEGYAVTRRVAEAWERTFALFSKKTEDLPELKTWFDVFAPDGRPVNAGELWKSPGHAKALREIGETNAESFYRGNIAEKLSAFSEKHGGFLRKEDLAAFSPEWIQPIATDYRGYDIWEMPPNGQGIVALMGLNILENFDFNGKDNPETYHKQIESLKLAFEDGLAQIADSEKMTVTVDQLLSKNYAQKRSQLVKDKAITPEPGEMDQSGTVYLAVADGEGNMISYIQSNYMGFGSGAVLPGYGISLHNRGNQFSLEETHPNVLEPGKRPFHTIIPGFITKNGEAVGPFGIMGGHMQPQAHLQVLSSMIDFGLNPQDALDAPRWYWEKEKKLLVEPAMPLHIVEELKRWGHDIQYTTQTGTFGRGQIILRDQAGTLVGGTEPRSDGHIAVW